MSPKKANNNAADSPAKKSKTAVHQFPVLKNTLIFDVINGKNPSKTPVWIMRQAGRYLPEFRAVRAQHEFFEVCRTPSLAAKVTLQPIERYEGLLDASIIFCDILVVPQAMGMECLMVPGRGPVFPAPLVTPEDLERFTMSPDVDKELGYVYEAITLTRHELKGRVPLFGFCGAPWTLMAYMIEGGGSKTLSKAKGWLLKYPKESKELLKKLADVCVKFLVGQVRAGAQLLQVFESWGGELSPVDFHEFSLPYLVQIVDGVKGALKEEELEIVPMAVFARGSHYALGDLEKTKYDIVSLDWTISPQSARESLTKTLQGNADPALLYASPEKIKEVTKNMIAGFKGAKWIANLGHGMHPDHDPEHLRAYLEAIKEYTSI